MKKLKPKDVDVQVHPICIINWSIKIFLDRVQLLEAYFDGFAGCIHQSIDSEQKNAFAPRASFPERSSVFYVRLCVMR